MADCGWSAECDINAVDTEQFIQHDLVNVQLPTDYMSLGLQKSYWKIIKQVFAKQVMNFEK
jgi:hypothetical protein